jgi:protein-S-isoprenylcysteine O-methyltransferase Ste14
MYLGVLILLLGEAILFDSVALLQYAAGWFVVIHLVVILYEEPALRRRFGESYETYCRSVRRWLPNKRVCPAEPGMAAAPARNMYRTALSFAS